MKRIYSIAGSAGGVLATCSFAIAADLPPSLPIKALGRSAIYDSTGFFIGGEAGYGNGGFSPGTNPLPEQGVFFPHTVTGLIGGFVAGYLKQFSNHVVLGIEADASFTSPVDTPALTPAPYNTTLDYVGTVRGRVGYAFGTLMPYVTGGFAWGHSHVDINDSGGSIVASPGQYQSGWTAGAGVEFAVSGNWSARLEYDYIDLARRTYDLSSFGLPNVNVEPNINLVKFGLNYRFGDTPPWAAPASTHDKTALPESDAWNVHAQTTFIPTGYPAFHSPYVGTNSLPGGGQIQQTWTTTAFVGVRLWQGGEFYFDPETAQGFGLNGTLGLAGFPNGEAQKAVKAGTNACGATAAPLIRAPR